jgi:hypothetical protein
VLEEDWNNSDNFDRRTVLDADMLARARAICHIEKIKKID